MAKIKSLNYKLPIFCIRILILSSNFFVTRPFPLQTGHILSVSVWEVELGGGGGGCGGGVCVAVVAVVAVVVFSL